MRTADRALGLALLVAFSIVAFTLPAPSHALIGQDDGGSGTDAANGVETTVSAQPDIVYDGRVGGSLEGDYGDWYRFEGLAGQRVQVRTMSNGLLCRWDIRDAAGTALPRECNVFAQADPFLESMPSISYEALLVENGTHYISAATWGPGSAGDVPYVYSFAFAVDGDAVAPVPTVEPPSFQGGSHQGLARQDCPGARPEELTRTSGEGDAAIPSLVWAATKTGFRVTVGFSEGSFGYVRLLDDEGGERFVWDQYEGAHHVIAVDVASPAGVLCFKAGTSTHNLSKEGDWHAVRLANAFNDVDPATGVYTINLLASVDERLPFGDAILDDGIARAAEIVWDASDGMVRLGRILVVRSPATHDVGTGCAIVVYGVLDTAGPGCAGVADYVFTYGVPPAAAAMTYADGIQDRHSSVWMNNLYEGYPLHSVREIGHVMAHELGHYAFGMMDLYSSAGVGPECYDPLTRISVMGSDREAREFDDETTRCPNEAAIAGYVPSWTRLRERFPGIPERGGPPVVGPVGDGGAFALGKFGGLGLFTPGAPQDDAGSGMDAPASPLPRVVVQPATVYRGALFGSLEVDQRDWFAFQGAEGQEVLLRTVGEGICVWSIRDAGGKALSEGCGFSTLDPVSSVDYRATLPADGTFYLAIEGLNLDPHVYSFSFGVDGSAPFPWPP